MNQKIPAICLITSFVVLLIFSFVSTHLESEGILSKEAVGPAGVIAILLLGVLLFLAISFSTIPLAVRFFINKQVKIGNGEHPSIKWLKENERTAVCVFWGIMGLGFLMALPVALVDWYRDIMST